MHGSDVGGITQVRHLGHTCQDACILQLLTLYDSLASSSALTLDGLMRCTRSTPHHSTQNSSSNITVAATQISHADSSDQAPLHMMTRWVSDVVAGSSQSPCHAGSKSPGADGRGADGPPRHPPLHCSSASPGSSLDPQLGGPPGRARPPGSASTAEWQRLHPPGGCFSSPAEYLS